MLVDQDVDELSDEKFSLEDLVRTKEYKDKTQLSGIYQPQILRSMNYTDIHILKVIKYLTV